MVWRGRVAWVPAHLQPAGDGRGEVSAERPTASRGRDQKSPQSALPAVPGGRRAGGGHRQPSLPASSERLGMRQINVFVEEIKPPMGQMLLNKKPPRTARVDPSRSAWRTTKPAKPAVSARGTCRGRPEVGVPVGVLHGRLRGRCGGVPVVAPVPAPRGPCQAARGCWGEFPRGRPVPRVGGTANPKPQPRAVGPHLPRDVHLRGKA